MAEHINPKLAILVDKSDNKRVYAATHTDGVVVDDGLWYRNDWNSEPGKLRLTKVLEKIPNLIDDKINSLTLDTTTNNGKKYLLLKLDNNSIGSPIELSGGLNIDTILVGSGQNDAERFLISTLNNDYVIPTGRAVYVAIDKTLGFVTKELDNL